MRIILVFLLLVGMAISAIGLFQKAENTAHWSNGYALFESLGDQNPLRNREIRNEFDRLFFKRYTSDYVLWAGVLVSILSVTCLLQTQKQKTLKPRQAEQGAAANP